MASSSQTRHDRRQWSPGRQDVALPIIYCGGAIVNKRSRQQPPRMTNIAITKTASSSVDALLMGLRSSSPNTVCGEYLRKFVCQEGSVPSGTVTGVTVQ